MYYFSIAAIFKNESMGLKEWIDHHILHGCEHFYLINDNSTDNYLEILKPYINLSQVTLFDNDLPKVRGRQHLAYDKYLKPIWKNTNWLAIIDIDEYLWSPKTIDIRDILKKYENYFQLEINWSMFGSNNHKTQPKSIVEGFTKRVEYGAIFMGKCPIQNKLVTGRSLGPKTILNTNFPLPTNFGVHNHGKNEKSNNLYINVSYLSDYENPELLINHYHLQSKEYWEKVKMARGDVNCWHPDDGRDWSWFYLHDKNVIDDFRLFDQNKNNL